MNSKPKRPVTPPFVLRLTSTLTDELARVGVKADVFAERIAGTKVHRIHVIAPKFKGFTHFERQNLVWGIAEGTLTTDDRLCISTILTATPDEMKGAA